jgi:radical SAM protein with 4Fe4S-binding SPASM domain
MMNLRNLPRLYAKTLRQPGYAVKTAVKRLRAWGSYVFLDGKSLYPEAVTLVLTSRCNLRCHMCGQWGSSGSYKTDDPSRFTRDLPFNRMRKLVEELSHNQPSITLFGGEPLLCSYCVDLVRFIKKKRMHCILITNGVMLENIARSIAASGLDELNVSIDGVGDMHDTIRGVSGAFEKIAAGLRSLQSIRRETGKGPHVNVQCTINRYNYGALESLVDFAIDVGARSITFHNLIFITKERLHQQKAADDELGMTSDDWSGFLSPPGIEPDVMYAQIVRLRRRTAAIDIDLYPNFSLPELRQYYRTDDSFAPPERQRCLSPWLVAYVFPDGDVRPCFNMSYSFGNIFRDPFANVWNSPDAVRYRRHLKAKKIFPACARCTELYRY